LRAALVNDWYQGLHGGERTAAAIALDVLGRGGLPDLYSFLAVRELLPPGLERARLRDSRLPHLPGLRQRGHDQGHWRLLLPYMPLYFRSLRLRGYDLVVSASHACAMHIRVPRGTPHVCYCHTPLRYVWSPEVDERGGSAPLAGPALRALAGTLRRADRAAAERVTSFVANSSAVRDRIARFYGRDAAVIPPPVEVGEFDPSREHAADHFVFAQRLVPYKRPLLVAEAFRDLPYRLTMVGVGPLERRLRERLPANVELRGWIPRAELRTLLEEATGFVHVGEEDFGIATVEALAAGTPVVGLDAGGTRDIVRPDRDGVLVQAPEVSELRSAIRTLANRQWDRSALAERAGMFSRRHFAERLERHIATLLPQAG
jgi:glycosyltransferase involved in cell wall biosynthesis